MVMIISTVSSVSRESFWRVVHRLLASMSYHSYANMPHLSSSGLVLDAFMDVLAPLRVCLSKGSPRRSQRCNLEGIQTISYVVRFAKLAAFLVIRVVFRGRYQFFNSSICSEMIYHMYDDQLQGWLVRLLPIWLNYPRGATTYSTMVAYLFAEGSSPVPCAPSKLSAQRYLTARYLLDDIT
ncbi:unnamed protein product [Rhizoctonia solani]|uniref:Uncharacterized protein n=1 Tax=Rhizoctonia solani TaxID=456999 RepID=A0A8H3B861_9AGAM|nr:unnamed protein product [Rhizoctonia solani]